MALFGIAPLLTNFFTISYFYDQIFVKFLKFYPWTIFPAAVQPGSLGLDLLMEEWIV